MRQRATRAASWFAERGLVHTSGSAAVLHCFARAWFALPGPARVVVIRGWDRSLQAWTARTCGCTGRPRPPLWVQPSWRFGKPYKRSNKISDAIRRVCKKVNINIGTLQTLRRSCNTLYKQYGLPNDWILDQLGHMQDDVNRKHYTGKIKPNLSRIGTLLSE